MSNQPPKSREPENALPVPKPVEPERDTDGRVLLGHTKGGIPIYKGLPASLRGGLNPGRANVAIIPQKPQEEAEDDR